MTAFLRRFAVETRRALLAAAEQAERSPESAALRFFCARTAFRYLEVNEFLPKAARGIDSETRAGFAEIGRVLAPSLPLFSEFETAGTSPFDPRLVPISQIPARLLDRRTGGSPGVLGRLYQYYKTEERETALAEMRAEKKTSRRRIPAATQLFTPEPIIRYLVENCVGRFWNAEEIPFHSENGYSWYLSDAPQEPETAHVLDELRTEWKTREPESLTLIDPCMGCGHILLNAFDALLALYVSRGRDPRRAVRSILAKNLYGYELDSNAAELARFSLTMKARAVDPGILKHANCPGLVSSAELPETASFGSLVRPAFPENSFDMVITNPPFMGRGKFPPELSAFLKREYPDGKDDLFAAFMVRCAELTKPRGLTAMITPQSWMFLTSFQPIRRRVLRSTLLSLLHLGPGVFETLTGEVTQTAAFVTTPFAVPGYTSRVFRLVNPRSAEEKAAAFFDGKHEIQVQTRRFETIPETPFVYSLGKAGFEAFRRGRPLREQGTPCQGLATADNARFLRLWYEVDRAECGFDCRNREEAAAGGKRWFPYNKGGTYRKWFGNAEYVIDWKNDGEALRNTRRGTGRSGAVLRNQHRYFQEGITWSKVSGGLFSVRYVPPGFLFDVAGCTIFYDDRSKMLRDFAFLNSAAAQTILTAVSPTLNFEVGHLAALPVLEPKRFGAEIESLVLENVDLARADWDTFETSWGFQTHPYMNGAATLERAFHAWEATAANRFRRLQENEERLNRIFLNLYKLTKSVSADVPDSRVSIRKADSVRDTKSFLSFILGTAFGRYKIPGAANTLSPSSPRRITVRRTPFPNETGVGTLVVRFLETFFPKETLRENLRFVQRELGGKKDEDPRETIRRYFADSFAEEHRKQYKNRPIYTIGADGAVQYKFS